MGLLLLWMAAACSAKAEKDAQTPPPFTRQTLSAGKICEEWVYASETSAIIYWQTENRARSRLEYGKTAQCEQRTPLSDISPISGQPYWTHFHRITGLQPGRQYHYRAVCLGTDGTTSVGEIKTFATKKYSQAVRIPDDLAGPPYVLDRPNTTYLLARDLTFPLGGLLIKADNVTLDMDGHAIVYNDEKAIRSPQWDKRAYEGHDFGVKVEGRVHATILNGSIRQGRGNTAGTNVGIGCNPVYSGGASTEIVGVDIAWSGDDVSGFFLHEGENDRVHHCVMEDKGQRVSDRHQAIRSVAGNGWRNYDHNLVKATRQQGLVSGVRVEHNEIYIRSLATNSFGVTAASEARRPVEIAHNRIFGIGEHPIGIGMFGAFPPGSTVHDNWVEVKCTRRGEEYGYTGSACFRTTWGADYLDVGGNTFIAYADLYDGQAAKARAIWVGLPSYTPHGSQTPIVDARGVFHDNLIVARGPDKAMAGGICVVCLNQSPNLIFRNNRVVSTWGNVVLADAYGHADGYAKFVGNTFQREGGQSDYYTVRQEYGEVPATGAFFKNRYDAGASEHSLKLLQQGEVVFLEFLDVFVRDQRGNPLGGARVAILDNAAKEVFADVTPEVEAEAMLVSREGPALTIERPPRSNAKGFVETAVLRAGQVKAILKRGAASSSGASGATSYAIRVTKEGFQESSQALKLNASRTLDITLIQ